MPRGRKPQSQQALSNAQRQARYRARRADTRPPTAPRPRTAARHTRPQRWRAAVAELVALQTEYAAWLDRLPEPLRDSTTGDALQAIVDLDLGDLLAAEPPRGYGRD